MLLNPNSVNSSEPAKSKNGSKRFLCDYCGSSFKPSGHLEEHEQVHQGVMFECPIESCDRKFSRKNLYMGHLNAHKGMKPYQCVQCGKSFSLRNSYITHKYKCSGLKTPRHSYMCKQCGKDFVNSGSLGCCFTAKYGEGRFVCSSCGKIFLYKGNL